MSKYDCEYLILTMAIIETIQTHGEVNATPYLFIGKGGEPITRPPSLNRPRDPPVKPCRHLPIRRFHLHHYLPLCLSLQADAVATVQSDQTTALAYS